MLYRYFIKIAFDGTGYNGWQVQKNSAQTVQAKINSGLSKLLSEDIFITGCCRTDAGVHARELYAHFDSKRKDLHDNSKIDWVYKFNMLMPKDIAIDGIYLVKNTLSARFDANARTYKYYIHNRRNPFLINRSYYFYGMLNVNAMNEAASVLLNHEDFSAFSKLNTQVKSTICKVKKAQWIVNGKGDMTFTIQSNRFLHGMVRMIVGTLILVGKGKMSIGDFEKILIGKDCRKAGALAPAHGLYLVKVGYPSHVFIQ